MSNPTTQDYESADEVFALLGIDPQDQTSGERVEAASIIHAAYSARLDKAEAERDKYSRRLDEAYIRVEQLTAERDALDQRNEELCGAIAGRITERDALQATVDKLPKTADGVVVVPGMELWRRTRPKGVIGESRIIRSFDIAQTDLFTNYFSTLDAAKASFAAKEAQP